MIDCKNDMKSLGVRPEIFPAYQVTGEPERVSPVTGESGTGESGTGESGTGESGTGESIREWVSQQLRRVNNDYKCKNHFKNM